MKFKQCSVLIHSFLREKWEKNGNEQDTCMLFLFMLDKIVAEVNMMIKANGGGLVWSCMCCEQFAKSEEGELDLEDKPCYSK